MAVAVTGWFGLDFKDESDPEPSIQTGNNSPVQTGSGTQVIQGDQGTAIIGMTIDQHESILKSREAELRADLTRASDAEKALFRQELDTVLGQMADLETSYQTALDDLRQLRAELDDLEGRVPQDQLDAAQQALLEGDRSKADTLLADVEAQAEGAIKIAAEAAYLRGEIAEQEIRWHDAAEHYARAARLDPTYASLVKASEYLWRAGKYPESIRFGEDLVAVSKREFGEEDERTASAINNFALFVRAQGRFAEAEEYFRQVLEIDRATIGEGHPAHATHLNNLAGVVRAQGRHAEAERLYRQAMAIDRVTIGEEHPSYATRLNNLAGVVQAQERYAEAEVLYLKALEIRRATIGESHPAYATHLNNLAGVVEAQERYEEAEMLYRQAIEIDRVTIGEDHPDFAIDLNNLAGVLQAQDRYQEAEGLYRRALQIFEQLLGEDHHYTNDTRENLNVLVTQRKSNDDL